MINFYLWCKLRRYLPESLFIPANGLLTSEDLREQALYTRGNVGTQILSTSHKRSREYSDFGTFSLTSAFITSKKMDYGTLTGSTYILRTDVGPTAIDSVDDMLNLHTFISDTRDKIFTAEKLRDFLSRRLKEMKNLDARGFENTVVTLRTMRHLYYRYQLVLTRDLLIAQEKLGTPGLPELWRNWYCSVASLGAQAPNVHDMYIGSSRGSTSADVRRNERYHFGRFWYEILPLISK